MRHAKPHHLYEACAHQWARDVLAKVLQRCRAGGAVNGAMVWPTADRAMGGDVASSSFVISSRQTVFLHNYFARSFLAFAKIITFDCVCVLHFC